MTQTTSYTPAQKVLGLILSTERKGAREAFDRLRALFPEAGQVPGSDSVCKAIFEILYAAGEACDLGALDLRTDGRYHDKLAHLLDVASEGESGLSELAREDNRQKMLVALSEAQGRLLGEGADPAEIGFKLRSVMDGLMNTGIDATWGDYVEMSHESMEAQARDGMELTAGLSELDGLFQWRRNHMTIVAARTSHGKTAFSLRMVWRALRNGLKVAYLGFEDYSTIPWKLASLATGCPLEFFTRYYAQTPLDKAKADSAINILKTYNGINVYPPMKLSEFDQRVKHAKPDLIVFDYVQRYAEAFGGEEKRNAVGRAASDFQSIIQRNRAYGIMCSQVRRVEFVKEQRGGPLGPRKPQLTDLKESGDLENYADAVILLYWPWRDAREAHDLEREKYLISVAKDKMGPGGDVECLFDGATMSYRGRYATTG